MTRDKSPGTLEGWCAGGGGRRNRGAAEEKVLADETRQSFMHDVIRIISQLEAR